MASSRKIKVLALSLGKGLEKVIGLAAMMVMARVLLKEDVAAYRQTLLAYLFVSPFLHMGLVQGIYYFLPVEKVRVRGRVIDAVTLLGAAGVGFAIFIALGGNQLLAQRFSNPQVAELLLWLIPYTIVTLPGSLVASVLVARDQALKASLFGVVRQVSIGVATIVPLFFWQTAKAPLMGNVVASVLLGFAAIAVMLKTTPRGPSRPSLPAMKEMLAISLPMGMATMLGSVSLQLDKMVVSVMATPEEFAVYAMGAIEVPFIAMVTGSITVVMLAEMRKAVDAGDSAKAVRLFRLTAEKSSCVILPVMLFLLVSADCFIETLYTDAYAESAIPFRIYLLRLPIRVVVFGSMLLALGKTRFILAQTAMALCLNCLWCYLLVLKFGAFGAAAGSALNAYLFVVPLNLWFIAKTVKVPVLSLLPIRPLLVILVQFLPVTVLVYFVDRYTGDLHAFVKLAMNAALFGAFFLFWAKGKLYTADELRGWRDRIMKKR